MRFSKLLLTLLVLTGGFWMMFDDAQAEPTPSEDSAMEKELLEADRQFDTDTASRRLDGWLTAFASDGCMQLSSGAMVCGHAAIQQLMGPAFARADFELRWEPNEAHVLLPGILGFTRGRYERRFEAEGEERVQTGTYVSVWRRQDDGSWKVVFDSGSDDSPPPDSERE